MRYTIILTEEPSGSISAIAPGLLEQHVQGQTRQDAIRKMRTSIAALLKRSEIVQLDIPVEPKNGTISREPPWEFFGKHQEDVNWGIFFEELDHLRTAECE